MNGSGSRRPTLVWLAVGLVLIWLQRNAELIAQSSCSIEATPVAFGAYDPFSASPRDSEGTMRFECTGPAIPILIEISRGSSGTFTPRFMTGPSGDRLPYNLYLDGNHATIWGDGTSGTQRLAMETANAKPTEVRIYGRIDPRQDVSSGSYSDSMLVTIVW